MSGQNQKTDKRIAWPIIIMNFTGVYDYEAFARNNKFIWLDCRHLYGTDGYCDREGALALKGMIADYPASHPIRQQATGDYAPLHIRLLSMQPMVR